MHNDTPPGEGQNGRRLRVMICDDSTTVRGALARMLEADPAIRVTERLGNGQQVLVALDRCAPSDWPDVLLLDLEMPVMDGLTALPEIIRRDPGLTVIVSAAPTQAGAAGALEAIRAGAADFLAKPSAMGATGDAAERFRLELIARIKGWARLRDEARAAHHRPALPAPTRALIADAILSPDPGHPSGRTPGERVPVPLVPAGDRLPLPRVSVPATPSRRENRRAGTDHPASQPVVVAPVQVFRPARMTIPSVSPTTRPPEGKAPSLVVVASSTGGPQALLEFVRSLPSEVRVPILVVQHMPAGFTTMLAQHLQSVAGGKSVREAVHGDDIPSGVIRIAPGDRHMRITPEGVIHLDDGPKENFCRPAADPLFRTAAQRFGVGVLGIVLTGMGQDGLLGAEEIRRSGGRVWSQDEASSVVWGMPGAVARAGVSDRQDTPARLAHALGQLCGARP